ncbi:MAG: hypothetical protein QXZ70_02190 [Candidatus Bathyarchaeia archaeon]
MLSTSKKKSELLKKLMEHFIDDVEKGVHPFQAGWIKIEGPEVNMLINSGLAQKGEKGIRLLFNKELQKEFGDSWDNEVEELLYICNDIARGVQVEKRLNQMRNDMERSSQLEAGIVVVGWWRMLETSGFPVLVDEVLREGFSPDKWYLDAPKTSLDLALTVAKKWYDDVEKALESVRKFSFFLPMNAKNEVVDKVKRVLKWEKALEAFSQSESKALAFLWCADYLSTSQGVCYSEAVTFVQRRAWELLAENLKKTKLEIVDEVEQMINELPSQDLISWAEIIRFPW